MTEQALIIVQQAYINKYVNIDKPFESRFVDFSLDTEKNRLKIYLKSYNRIVVFELHDGWLGYGFQNSFPSSFGDVSEEILVYVNWYDSVVDLFSVDAMSIEYGTETHAFCMTVSHSEVFFNVLLELGIKVNGSVFHGYYPLGEKSAEENDLLIALETWKSKLTLF